MAAGKKNILLFYPPNSRSIAIETICKAMKAAGHSMIVLTLSARGAIHEELEKAGIETAACDFPRKPSWKFYWLHIRHLLRFCRQRKIDTIWSHFPEANVISLIVQRFVRAKVFVWRHHDETTFYARYGKQFGMVRHPGEIRIDKIINRFARHIVVLSTHVRQTMLTYEACAEKKILVCPLIYDFSLYPRPDAEKLAAIREQLPCELLLIMVSRMIVSKQHQPVFEVLRKLLDEGMSIRMIVMDDGPLRPQLEGLVNQLQLQQHVLMPGYSTDLINYMAAADLLMHPSLTEASSNVVKEMGHLGKPVAICREVGDFDDYVQDGVNGFVMSRDELKPGIEKAIRSAYQQKNQLPAMGRELQQSVYALFADTPANRERYLQLI